MKPLKQVIVVLSLLLANAVICLGVYAAESKPTITVLTAGNKDAPIKIEYFWSGNCLHSPLAYKHIVTPLLLNEVQAGKVLITFFYYMKTKDDFDNGSVYMCVPPDQQFALMARHQLLAADHKIWPHDAEETFKLAKNYGVTAENVAACITEDRIRALFTIRKVADARYQQFERTPAFIVNGEYVGAQTFMWEFREKLEEMGIEL